MKLSRIHTGTVLDFFTADLSSELELPLSGTGIAAGFPSPAEDYEEVTLDLNKALIKHPAATFYARVKGTSMTDAGILDGDLLVIDKALDPREGDIAVCLSMEHSPSSVSPARMANSASCRQTNGSSRS